MWGGGQDGKAVVCMLGAWRRAAEKTGLITSHEAHEILQAARRAARAAAAGLSAAAAGESSGPGEDVTAVDDPTAVAGPAAVSIGAGGSVPFEVPPFLFLSLSLSNLQSD